MRAVAVACGSKAAAMNDGSGTANTDSRTRVLGAVRSALGHEPAAAAARKNEIEERLAAREVHVRPPVEGDLAARFAEKVELVAATFVPAPTVDHVSGLVSSYLEERGIDKEIVATTDPLVEAVRWSNEFAVARGRAAEPGDRVSVVGAYAGIAETGTLVFVSDRATPTTLNFLPEFHIAVLARDRLVAHLEDVWVRLRSERSRLPRTVNFITGPSRTGDIELQLELGAHGPRRLHVVLVDG